MGGWSDEVYEAVGSGRCRPSSEEQSLKGYFSGEFTKYNGSNWKYVIQYRNVDRSILKGEERGHYFVSVGVYYFAKDSVYLVDGSVSFPVSDIDEKDFTVGEIQESRHPQWKQVFYEPDIELSYECGGEPFTIRVGYRVDKYTVVLASRTLLHRPKVPEPLQTLSSDFKKLLFSSASSDVVFKIGEESVPAHQLVLATRVPYFERLFASGMEEANSRVITIEDADVASLKQLLKFIYSGELPDDLNASAETYLLMADKYDIQDLKSSCSRALTFNLKRTNVVKILMLAHSCHCLTLKEQCFHKLKKWKSELSEEDLEPLKLHSDLMFEFFQFV